MNEVRLVVREPLLDTQQQVLGYEFSWMKTSLAENDEIEDARSLVNLLLENIENGEDAPPTKYSHFLYAPAPLIMENVFSELPPSSTNLIVSVSDLEDDAVYAEVKVLRKAGYGILLRGVDMKALNPKQLILATAIEVYFDPDNFSSQARIYGVLKNSPIRMIARKINNWQEYDACGALGLQAFAGRFYLTTRQIITKNAGLNPSQVMLLQLMELVRNNADIPKIEDALKHDPAISYKLLHYINSAGFGLGFEIESMRHAIQVLGYNPLYRWLSVLLASANASTASLVLMQAAITRGRLMEVLGKSYLSKSEAENLFITGMFSLLDRLLGVTMEDALDQIQLPDAVTDALMTRQGIYAPFLLVAEACEQSQAGAFMPSCDLSMDMNDVNKAHLRALFWAQRLES
jgi:EAL and modified HD-GYP domain-containing signal transduction protein